MPIGFCTLLALSLGSVIAASGAIICAPDDTDCFAALSLEESGLQAAHIGRNLNADTGKVYKCTINGHHVDANGEEITRSWIRPGHSNDGNEGNEGNEGREGNNDVMVCAWVDADEPVESAEVHVVSRVGDSTQCGQFLSNSDVPGVNLAGSGKQLSSDQKCLDLCSKTATCNAAVRLSSNGKCYIKKVANDVKTMSRTGTTAFIMCSEVAPPPATDPFTPSPDIPRLTIQDNLRKYFSNNVCPSTVTTVQWTGRSSRLVGLPGAQGLRDFYMIYGGENYDNATNKITLPFNELPEDLTYCNEPPINAQECQLTPFLKGSGTSKLARWSYNPSTEKCEKFVYLGSGGNKNNYVSQSMCMFFCENPELGTMGGQVFFQDRNGTCVLPPTKVDGKPCCTMKMWQPNYAGFYYDNCSAKVSIGSDGVYFFKTAIPGSEADAGWGPDPEAHIHYDIECDKCAQNNIFEGQYRYWNKFYPKDICTLVQCYGNKANIAKLAGPQHQAVQKKVNGEIRYTYNMRLPPA